MYAVDRRVPWEATRMSTNGGPRAPDHAMVPLIHGTAPFQPPPPLDGGRARLSSRQWMRESGRRWAAPAVDVCDASLYKNSIVPASNDIREPETVLN